jgi:hypothetical protein
VKTATATKIGHAHTSRKERKANLSARTGEANQSGNSGLAGVHTLETETLSTKEKQPASKDSIWQQDSGQRNRAVMICQKQNQTLTAELEGQTPEHDTPSENQ